MEHYELKSDETVLYRGEVIYPPQKRGNKNQPKAPAEIILTNFNIVLSITTKKFLHEIVSTEIYNVNEIKTYDNSAQIIRKGTKVDIYLISTELFLTFKKRREAHMFTDIALRLVSGQSKFVRAVRKIKKTVNETNEALDIDIGQAAKSAAIIAGNVAVDVACSGSAGKKTKFIGTVIKSVFKQSKTQPMLTENFKEVGKSEENNE